jgi:predicted Zn-dependent peptidase
MESISNMLLNFKLQHYQIPKVEAGVALDREIASSDVDSQLWEQAFSAAYRTGLGNSPLSNKINHAPIESVNTFLMTAMKRSGHVVAASGLGRLELSEPLKHIFTATVPKLQLVEGASKYFGGERRVEYNDGDDGKNHVLIAFGTSGAHNKSESHAVRIMAALIGSGQTVQHGRGQSHLDGIRELLAKNREISIAAHVRQYSDGGLMGIKISAPVEFEMKPVLESICKELNAIGTGRFATGALSGAKSRAAYEAIAELDTRLGQATALATNVLIYNAPLNIQADLASLHSLSSADFKAMASKIFSRKPVVVSLGRLASLPFADELSC